MTGRMNRLIGRREAYDDSCTVAFNDHEKHKADQHATVRSIRESRARWDRALKMLTDAEQAVFDLRKEEGPGWAFKEGP